jgi:phospholipid/cholesterol/gamma-HCH transport system permease protein
MRDRSDRLNLMASETVSHSQKNFIIRQIEALGAAILDNLFAFGSFISFVVNALSWLFRPPFRLRLFFEQLYFVGNKSIFIIVLSGSFTGMVMAYQTYFGFKLISVDSLVGPVTALTLAKELAPVLTGLIVAGRAGAAMTAQIGSMKVTEQIDALEVMGINSVQYLAVPRIVAGTISVPMLSALFLFIGNIGSYIVGTKFLSIDEAVYLSKLGDFMFLTDIWQGLIKATFFGFLISCIGTYFGFNVTKGAEGVGKGTNLSVVWGMIMVLITDYFLTSFLIHIL